MPMSMTERPSGVIDVFTSFQEPGYRLVDASDLEAITQLLFSTREGIQGGTGQADAYPLQQFISNIADGTSVMLPIGQPGRYVMVNNDSAAGIQVYAQPYNPLTGLADSVADAANSTQQVMIMQPAGSIAEYICFAPGLWKQFSGADASGAAGPGGGLPEAPIDGVTYGRLDGNWVPVLGLNGGTMTGPLILAPGPITNANQAVTLNFVENMNIDEGTY